MTTQVIKCTISLVDGINNIFDEEIRGDTNSMLEAIQRWFSEKNLELVAIQQIQVLKKNHSTTKTYRYNVVLRHSSHPLTIGTFIKKVDSIFNVSEVELK